jgi:3-hydroxyisobutyrate dehydrogenase-like beta-hydroxyacid dehydrogenase
LEEVSDLNQLISKADILLSICPPIVAEEIAQAVADHKYSGIFVEANAISPARCIRIVTVLQNMGARVVDGAIFGPPPTKASSVRLYLAGEPNETRIISQVFIDTAVRPVILKGQPPIASVLKIADAGYHKATRALAAIAHAVAAEYGVSEHLLSEADRIEDSPLTNIEYLPSVAARAWRWAPEMLEVADALTDVGLPNELALAAAKVLDHWHDDKDDWHIALPRLLQRLKSGSASAVKGTES